MADVSLRLVAACSICGSDTQLDDFGRCQDCVEAAELRAVALDDLEHAVSEALHGLTADQVRQAVELVLANAEGQITGDIVGRELTPLRPESIWRLVEPSTWLLGDRPNRIKQCRQASRMSRQQLAELMGVDVDAVAGWERPLRPDLPLGDNIDKLCELFGVSALHLFPEDD